MTTVTPEMLTVSELCIILKISTAHAYHLIYSGEIPAIRIGYSWRIPIAALTERLLEKLAYQQRNYNGNNSTNMNSNK